MRRSKIMPSVTGNQTFRSSTRSSGRSRRPSPRSSRLLGRERQAGAARSGRDIALVAGVEGDLIALDPQRIDVELVRRQADGDARRQRRTKPGRRGGPAAASSGVGGLWQAIWCVARGPVVTIGVPGVVGTSAGLSVQQTVEPPRAARGERAADRRRRWSAGGPRSGSAPRRRVLVEARDRVEQADRVRVRRHGEQVAAWSRSRR